MIILPGCRQTVGKCHSLVLAGSINLSNRIPAPAATAYCCSLRYSTNSTSSGRDDGENLSTKLSKFNLKTPPNLVEAFQSNVNWMNQQYERFFGIAEIRNIQSRVLEAERDFVEITQQRKSYQEQIEKFKEDIKSIRDKLDMTPRQSDNYLRLITEEHKLLREQLTLDAQLNQLKNSEQLSLDNLSKLLRQSHELERLRQERSKYWQLISIALSVAGSFVALVAQKSRSQKSIMLRLESMDNRFLALERSLIDSVVNQTKEQYDELELRLDRLDANLELIMEQVLDSNNKANKPAMERVSWASWLVSWIPGSVKSIAGY